MTTETTSPQDLNTENERAQVMISMPEALKTAIESAATNADKSVAAFCREIIADHINYTGPLARDYRRSRKYASEEERKKAQAARQKARRDFINEMLKKYGDEFKDELLKAEEEAVERALSEEDEDEDDDDDTVTQQPAGSALS